MTFGKRIEGAHRTMLTSDQLYPGRAVRYGSRRATVVAVFHSAMPSGGRVSIALIKFPRGELRDVFASQLEAVE